MKEPSRRVVSREDWIQARKKLLLEEKELTRLRDGLSAARRDLPWVRVDKEYVFDAPSGKESLAELFGGRRQLVVYHFMFGPSWDEGCKSCSFWADNFDGIDVHLRHRDTTLLFVSRAPLGKLEEYKARMGWRFKWVSSHGTEFNQDFQVSFGPEEMERGEVYYNYAKSAFPSDEAPGVSVFYKNEDGSVFHTYSCYSRGLDILNGAYHLLDLTPKGRDERDLPYGMSWLRHRDRYED